MATWLAGRKTTQASNQPTKLCQVTHCRSSRTAQAKRKASKEPLRGATKINNFGGLKRSGPPTTLPAAGSPPPPHLSNTPTASNCSNPDPLPSFISSSSRPKSLEIADQSRNKFAARAPLPRTPAAPEEQMYVTRMPTLPILVCHLFGSLSANMSKHVAIAREQCSVHVRTRLAYLIQRSKDEKGDAMRVIEQVGVAAAAKMAGEGVKDARGRIRQQSRRGVQGSKARGYVVRAVCVYDGERVCCGRIRVRCRCAQAGGRVTMRSRCSGTCDYDLSVGCIVMVVAKGADMQEGGIFRTVGCMHGSEVYVDPLRTLQLRIQSQH
ncbi:hypothetical protein IWX49DRAFT_302529 [Phyllosticta citricarpa]|uniref:Uncharacterized protein n=2 Tax=Phyllosticta TaxID=121621 RepID=A0ABR1LH14_9PEZI